MRHKVGNAAVNTSIVDNHEVCKASGTGKGGIRSKGGKRSGVPELGAKPRSRYFFNDN